MRLQGKIALVTGSDRGIGKGIALRFAREGADVVVNYAHNQAAAEAVKHDIEKLGRRGAVIGADVGSAPSVQKLIADAVRAPGRLDILVNNAGVEVNAAFTDVSESDYDKVLNVNLKGVFFATQAFAKHVIEGKRPGRVINISSVHEEMTFPGYAAYCASKGGVKMLTRDLAVELGPHGITVNSVAPGAIETDINKSLDEQPEKRAALLTHIPLGRLGSVDDVAGVAAFLASDDAAYVTGSTYLVDGGLSRFYKE